MHHGESEVAAAPSMGRISMSFDWDWSRAEKEFHRALALNPNYATAHQWYANYLLAMGRTREAIGEIQQALELYRPSFTEHKLGGRLGALHVARVRPSHRGV